MDKGLFDGLPVFLLVAEQRSFARAASLLDVSPTAVGKAIRQLEKRHGVVLFQRTTRRVALTEAGEALFQRVRPAATEIADALTELGSYSREPSGTLRLTMSRPAMSLIVEPVMAEFRRIYPQVVLDISIDEGTVNLGDGAFDAGIRMGESVEKDMIAVRLTPQLRWCVVGSPAYLERMGCPQTPESLQDHEAIVYRYVSSGQRYRWEFARDGRDFTIDVQGHVIVNDRASVAAFARAGLGLAYVAEYEVAGDLAAGRLVPVLDDYLTPSAGMFLYFPARMQTQPKLRAFIDLLRWKGGRAPGPST